MSSGICCVCPCPWYKYSHHTTQFQANCCLWNWDKICAIWLIGASLIYQVANLKPQSHKQENAYCPGTARYVQQFQAYLFIFEHYDKEIPLEKTTLGSTLQRLIDKALSFLRKAGPSELCYFSLNYAWKAFSFKELEGTRRLPSDATQKKPPMNRECAAAPLLNEDSGGEPCPPSFLEWTIRTMS